MRRSKPVTALFLDIGNVLLSNAWDSRMRKKAAREFGLDFTEMSGRHNRTFVSFELGRISLGEYLDRVVFYNTRPFTGDEFRAFMFRQSKPFQEMLDLVAGLKENHRLKTVAVNNEGRELANYRIEKFRLRSLIDFFVYSCFVHSRKPDIDMYLLALDCAQTSPEEVVYIDDRAMFVEVAIELGMHGLKHTDYESTRGALEALGLTTGGPASQTGTLENTGAANWIG